MELTKEIELLRDSWTDTTNKLHMIYTLSMKAAQANDIAELIEEFAMYSFILFEAEAFLIYLLNEKEELEVYASRSSKSEVEFKVKKISKIESIIAGDAIKNSGSVIINEVEFPQEIQAKLNAENEIFKNLKIKNMLCLPVVLDGRVNGVIEVINKNDGIFLSRDKDFMTALANIFSIILNRYHTKSPDQSAQVQDTASFESKILDLKEDNARLTLELKSMLEFKKKYVEIANENEKMNETVKAIHKCHLELLNNMHDGILIINKKGSIEVINKKAAGMLAINESSVGKNYKTALSGEKDLVSYLDDAFFSSHSVKWQETTINSTKKHVYFSTFNINGENSCVGLVFQDMVLGR